MLARKLLALSLFSVQRLSKKACKAPDQLVNDCHAGTLALWHKIHCTEGGCQWMKLGVLPVPLICAACWAPCKTQKLQFLGKKQLSMQTHINALRRSLHASLKIVSALPLGDKMCKLDLVSINTTREATLVINHELESANKESRSSEITTIVLCN